jgi:hypothetical protein
MENHHLLLAGETISIVAVIGTLAGWLPDAAAGAALIWYLIHIYEYFREPRPPL